MESNPNYATRVRALTQQDLDARNAALAAMQASGTASPRAEQSGEVHNSLRLPDYTRWPHEGYRT